VAGALALWLAWDSRFYVYDAEVVGTRQLSQGAVFEASRLEGLHVLWARPGAVESDLLEAFPSLESVSVSCSLPAECTISVVERQPRVLWYDQDEMWWIDEEGAVFSANDAGGSPEGANEAAGWWVVRGPLPRGDDGNLDERVRVALTELWASGRDVPTEFTYESDRGLSFTDRRGWRVIVGRGSGMDERLRALERLTAHLESNGVTPAFVDVRFPEAPYYSQTLD
jgi:cell division septal protein FtsQ